MSRRGVLSFLPALLFGVFPVVALYAHNIEQLKRDQLWSPLALAAAMAGGVFWVSFWVARRNADRASVMSSALLVCFFAYGHVVQFVKPYVPLRLVPFWALAVFVLFCGVIVAVVCWARRSQAVPGRATVVLNVVGAFLVMSSGIRVVAFERSVRVSEPLWRLPSGGGVLEGDRALPNIVHLVFDRYPSLSTLRDLYGYDNREFLDSLKMLGFFVAESSCCNYGSTDMSLSSTLNLDYVDSLFYAVPVAIRSRVWAEAMQNNRVVGLLKQQGYRYTHMGSW